MWEWGAEGVSQNEKVLLRARNQSKESQGMAHRPASGDHDRIHRIPPIKVARAHSSGAQSPTSQTSAPGISSASGGPAIVMGALFWARILRSVTWTGRATARFLGICSLHFTADQ